MHQLKLQKTSLMLVISASLLSACNSKLDLNLDDDKFNKIQGIWERKGYGEVFVIKDNKADTYEFTRNSCIRSETLRSTDFTGVFSSFKVASDKQSFTTKPDIDLFTLSFTKLSALPVHCESNNLITTSEPSVVFDHFWHSFNDYYAFFNEQGVDWNQQFSDYYPEVNDNISDSRLFDLLSKMLEPIDDGHIELSSSNRSFSPESNTDYVLKLVDAFNQQTVFQDVNEFISAQVVRARSNTLSYVSNIKHAGGKQTDAVSWGIIDNTNDEVGYINFSRMLGFSKEYSNEEDENEDSLSAADDIKALNKIMDNIMSDLKNTQSMIIDVRLNPGGFDKASFTIANRFASQRKRVLSKFTRTVAGETPRVHAYLEPTTNTYNKPVVILSSETTASAAEIFLMAMSALPQITLIGDPSSGALSDTLGKVLPNGWDVTFSNEVYLDYLGKNHEVSGVPMDVITPAFKISDLQPGKDGALETALDNLGYILP